MPGEDRPTVRERAVGRTGRSTRRRSGRCTRPRRRPCVGAALELLDPRPGERAWDLYGGAGLFAAALAARVGPNGRVTLVESAPDGVAAARDNLADLPWVEVVPAEVETALSRRRVAGPVDVVVLDPPRTGAGAEVVEALIAVRRRARSAMWRAIRPRSPGTCARSGSSAGGWRSYAATTAFR